MRKTVGLLLVWLLSGAPLLAQITVPNVFVPGTVASSSQVNANFETLGTAALHRGGGTITGNIAVDPGITVDGVDISEILHNNSLTIGSGIFTSTTPPQLTVAYDPAHALTIGVDQNGNAVFDLGASGAGFTFADTVTIGTLALTTLQCSGCVGPSQLQDNGVAAGIYGDATTVARINVDADGRILQAVAVPIAFPPQFSPTPGTVPESALIDGSILTRIAANETITGAWTFTQAASFQAGLNGSPLVGKGVGIASGLVLESGSPAMTRLTIRSNPAQFDFDVAGVGIVTTIWGGGLNTMAIRPLVDNAYDIGDSTHRYRSINLSLPNNTAPGFVVVNKGGAGLDRDSALGYIIGYAANSEQIKQMGTCIVSIRSGIITNVTGC